MEGSGNRTKFTVLLCGGRNWTDRDKIRNLLTGFDSATTLIVEGGCRGADTIGREEAEKLGFEVITMKAEWKKFGKGAGQIRNQMMYATYSPDMILAFHEDLNSSKGTKHMIEVAKRGGTPVRLTV